MHRLHKLLNPLYNNFIMHFILRKLGLDGVVVKWANPYHAFEVDANKSVQENAGYSIRPEINEVIEKSKNDLLNTVKHYTKTNDKILDIGCGPGMYLAVLKELPLQFTATDINKSMLQQVSKQLPNVELIEGDITQLSIFKKFHFIYCTGLLVYIPPRHIENFFKKLFDLLEENGILYLNYPHAIRWLDTVYHDMSYSQYSPQRITKWASSYFEIIEHHHAFDGRIVEYYDKQPYQSLNPNTSRTYKNSYVLIARKKQA
jgi:ubiquinone/menaquinone biosynthesis C-methylase UbiE